MTYIVEITEVATGRTRSYQEPHDWHRKDGTDWFLWEEGNYSCDCNRRLFFARAAGEPEDWEGECSDHKYRVMITDLDGTVLYAEEMPTKVAEIRHVIIGDDLPTTMLWSNSPPPTASDWLQSQFGKQTGWTG